jgi:hypothetical protein
MDRFLTHVKFKKPVKINIYSDINSLSLKIMIASVIKVGLATCNVTLNIDPIKSGNEKSSVHDDFF